MTNEKDQIIDKVAQLCVKIMNENGLTIGDRFALDRCIKEYLEAQPISIPDEQSVAEEDLPF